MQTKEMLHVNMLMELIWIDNGSSMGLSNDQREELNSLYKKLNSNGKEFFKHWASENDLVIKVQDEKTN